VSRGGVVAVLLRDYLKWRAEGVQVRGCCCGRVCASRRQSRQSRQPTCAALGDRALTAVRRARGRGGGREPGGGAGWLAVGL
jgi:hypothetical protein